MSLLHLSVGNSYPLTDQLVTPEPSLENKFIPPFSNILPLKLGYGELPYSQTVNNKNILEAYSENLSQVFGWDALKPPEKFAPQYMEENIKEKQKDEEDKQENIEKDENLSENDAIYVYLRCDEGKGNTISDVINGKIININEDQWAGVLEEGDPLDYDDK